MYGFIGTMATKSVVPLLNLNELDRMSGKELREHFKSMRVGQIPKNASRSFLTGHLAWANQVRNLGLDPKGLRAQQIQQLRQAKRQSKSLYKVGTRMVREWQGTTYEVTIEENGFSWNGERYRSLSEIARKITGTRWSGPRFFGLTKKDPGVE